MYYLDDDQAYNYQDFYENIYSANQQNWYDDGGDPHPYADSQWTKENNPESDPYELYIQYLQSFDDPNTQVLAAPNQDFDQFETVSDYLTEYNKQNPKDEALSFDEWSLINQYEAPAPEVESPTQINNSMDAFDYVNDVFNTVIQDTMNPEPPPEYLDYVADYNIENDLIDRPLLFTGDNDQTFEPYYDYTDRMGDLYKQLETQRENESGMTSKYMPDTTFYQAFGEMYTYDPETKTYNSYNTSNKIGNPEEYDTTDWLK